MSERVHPDTARMYEQIGNRLKRRVVDKLSYQKRNLARHSTIDEKQHNKYDIEQNPQEQRELLGTENG